LRNRISIIGILNFRRRKPTKLRFSQRESTGDCSDRGITEEDNPEAERLPASRKQKNAPGISRRVLLEGF
jgi:hypothetical protein